MPFAVICLDRPRTSGLRTKPASCRVEYIHPRRPKMRVGRALADDAGDERGRQACTTDPSSRQPAEASMCDEPCSKAAIFGTVVIRWMNVVRLRSDPCIFDGLMEHEHQLAGA